MANYHMNKKEREITDRNVPRKILKQGKYVTISMCRDNEPYIVTLSYGYDQVKNALYFHCALKGLKLDFIKFNPNVCATVIEDKGYKMGKCSQAYRSVVFWGKMHLVKELKEKKYGMDVLLNHLEDTPEKLKKKNLKTEETYSKVAILRLDIEEMKGKQG
jgi:nitroimidazol reductase NimA-like FMN-containing flavoprotein (pyridoxamine 5'-phosphate oxidase superfamily)